MAYNKRTPGTMASSTAPSDKNIIWLDDSSGNNIPKVYNSLNQKWIPIMASGDNSETQAQIDAIKRQLERELADILASMKQYPDIQDLNSVIAAVNNLSQRIEVGEDFSYNKDEVNQIINYLATLNYVDEHLLNKADIGSSYSKQESDQRLSEKANRVEVISQLNNKADLTDVYTRDEVRLLLQSMQDSDTPMEPVDLSMYYTKTQADHMFQPITDLSTYLTEEEFILKLSDYDLSIKSSISSSIGDLNNRINSKADFLAVQEAMSKKADMISTYGKEDVDTKLASYATKDLLSGLVNKSRVEIIESQIEGMNVALMGKADTLTLYNKIEIDGKINTKMDKFDLSLYAEKSETASISDSLSKKADSSSVYDKTYIDTQINKKMNVSDFENRISSYYNSTTSDILFATKDNLRSYYTKAESDGLLGLKVNTSTLSGYTSTVDMNSLLSKKADQLTTYTKLEANGLLDAKAEKSTTYSKADVDDKLSLKVNNASLSSYYTKTESNSLLNAKASQSTTYTKNEVDNFLSAKSNSDHTHANLHSPFLLGTKTLDEAKIGANRVLAYNAATGKVEYAGIIFQNLLGIGTIVFNFN